MTYDQIHADLLEIIRLRKQPIVDLAKKLVKAQVSQQETQRIVKGFLDIPTPLAVELVNTMRDIQTGFIK